MLSRTDLIEANFVGAILTSADLSEANLRAAKFGVATLYRANLSAADLTVTDLCRANFQSADLSRANLCRANCDGADLRRANLSGADLRGVNLSRTKLIGAEFIGTNLGDADFTGALVGATTYAFVDLSTTKGLDTVWHFGPSTIGIDTVYKSGGKISEAFLRGCGVPDEFIAFIGSMVERPIENFKCFISYSSGNQEFAEKLYADLQAKGVRCWFAPHDIKGGRKIHEQIDEAIRLHDRLLLILSEDSMNSDWVKTEIAKARKMEPKTRRVLFPVRLVSYAAMQRWEYIDSSGKDLAEEIRQYFIPDFSKWRDPDSYQAALLRLVGDLKAVVSG